MLFRSVQLLTGVTAISGGGGHSLALKNDSTVWSFGFNSNGQLGDGTTNGSSIPIQVSGLCPVSNAVNEINTQASISVYPNPSSGEFTIQMADGTCQMADIKIYTVLGECIYKSFILNPKSLIGVSLPSGTGQGIYFLELKTREGNVAVKKIVINK